MENNFKAVNTNKVNEEVIDAEVTEVVNEETQTQEDTKYHITELDWDAVVDGKEYKVIITEGLNHQFGGELGRTDLWLCPRDEQPSENNIIPYIGGLGGVCWEVKSDKHNTIVDVFDEENNPVTKVCLTNTSYAVTRNGKIFAPVSSRFSGEQLIEQLQRVPFFNSYNYEEKIVGRKIYWNDQPAIITEINNGELTIVTDGIDSFNLPLYMRNMKGFNPDETYNQVKAFINDQYIYWDRE